jgi:hypothetical protein
MTNSKDSYDGGETAAGQGQTDVPPPPASQSTDGGSPSAALLGTLQTGSDSSASSSTTYDAGSPSAELVAAIAAAGLAPAAPPLGDAQDGGNAPDR